MRRRCCRSSYISVPPDSPLHRSNIYTRTGLTRDHLYAITAPARAAPTPPVFTRVTYVKPSTALPAPAGRKKNPSCRHVSAPVTPRQILVLFLFNPTADSELFFIDSCRLSRSSMFGQFPIINPLVSIIFLKSQIVFDRFSFFWRETS